MYPEGGNESGGQDYYPPSDLKGKLGYHLEGFIPLILIIVIVFFLAVRFDIVTSSTPIVGPVVEIFEGTQQPSSMLIIGASSQEVIDVLNDNSDLVHYRIKTPDSMRRNPKEQLAQFDIVMLDQSQQANKEVSRELGEAIEKYVGAGGKLIVVLDSGIRRPGAFDVIGWENTFGNTVPVSCDRIINDIPVCLDRRIVRGELKRTDEDHPIMRGIEIFPAEPNLFAIFETFDVTPTGREIAFIEEASSSKKTYPGIVEKPTLIGKSIYFNYNPGITRGILESTLRYLR